MTEAKMNCIWRNRKSHPVLLSSMLPSLVAYWGQGRVAVHWLSGEPLRRSSKTNHQWEVKLLQCHSDNPQWCRHTSSAKFCGWIPTRTKMFPNSFIGVRVSRHGWTSWINHTSMTESVEPESLKEQQSGFWASFILADCRPHGWGKLSPSKRRLLCEKHWIMHLRREGRLAAGSNTTPSSFTSFPIHWQIDEGI